MKHLLSFLFLHLVFLHLIPAQIPKKQSLRDETLKTNQKAIEKLLRESEFNALRKSQSSVVKARKALKLSKIENSQKLITESYFQLGYAHYNLNHYDSAITFLQKAAALSQQADNKTMLALTYNRLGNTYQLKGRFNKAIQFYEKALKVNNEIHNSKEIARSLSNIGSVYQTFGEYNKAIQFQLKALSIYQQIDFQEGIAWSSLNISRLFKLHEQYAKALDYVDQSIKIYRAIAREQNIETGVTLCLKEYGLIYSLMGNHDQALRYINKVLRRNQNANNQYGIANAYHHMGKIYFSKQEYPTSLEYLNNSLNIKNRLNDRMEIPSILRLMGEIHLEMKEKQVAMEYFTKALNLAREQNMKAVIEKLYWDFYHLHKINRQYQKALHYHTLWSALKDSLNNQRIAELEMQYEFKRKQEQLQFEQQKREAIQQTKIKKQRVVAISSASGFFLLLALSVVIYHSYKRKVRSNVQLARQNQEIENQKEEIEAQRNMATEQRDKIARQNEIITESISYASRIQNAVLPQQNTVNNIFPDYFIYYKPKNIVSGDFYWINQIDSKIVIAAADCTGHGVPGAFMSMLGTAFLNEIINQKKILDPGHILYKLRKTMIHALHQDAKKTGSRDGMDIALSIIDMNTRELYFSGAFNPLYIIRDNTLIELRANRMPIGVHGIYQNTAFSVEKIQIKKDDLLYFFSDGYSDQFGGENGVKFGKQAFRKLLLNIHQHAMEEQKELLDHNLQAWQKNWSQIDDIMVLGFKVNHIFA